MWHSTWIKLGEGAARERLLGVRSHARAGVPWAALASEPVKVKVIGVNLLVGPLTSEQMTVASARQRFVENKGRTLGAADHQHCSSPRRKRPRRRARR